MSGRTPLSASASAGECSCCGFKETGSEGEKKLSWCPCRLKKYCGRDCQRAEWASHKDLHLEQVKIQEKGGPPFPFATKINSESDLCKAFEAVQMHDKPFSEIEMFAQMTTSGGMVTIGGQQNDAPKGPPFNERASLVLLKKEIWLVVQSPGEDISDNPNMDFPDAKEAAELTGYYLSYYYSEMQWHGLQCYLSRPDHFIAIPFNGTNHRMPVSLGPLPLPKALVEGSRAAERAKAVVVARSDGRDWRPLRDYIVQHNGSTQ